MQRFPKLHRSHGRDTFTVHPTAPDNELGYGLGAEDMGFSYGYGIFVSYLVGFLLLTMVNYPLNNLINK